MRSPVLAILAVAFLSLATGVQAQYLNLAQYDNIASPPSFAQADINGDGKDDIVGIWGVPPSEIRVLLANGTGGFGTPIPTTISGVGSLLLPQAILGDYNGDGHLDVALFGKDRITGQNVVAVMLGNGDGTFQAAKETIQTGATPSNSCGVGTADFNGDNKVDIVFTSNTSVVVLPGKGDGTFSAPLTTSTGVSSFTCLAPGDFNNDKKLDLALATSGGQIAMMLGKGDGTFQSPFGVGKGGNKQLIVAQLNGDNNLDLVAAQFSSPASVTVLLGDGTGHFSTSHTYDGLGTELFRVAVQDLNGDGHPDLAFLTGFGGSPIINIFLNNSDGSFTAGKTYNGDGQSVIGLYAGDLNGDQKVDLAFGNKLVGISVLLGNGNGTFQGNFVSPANPQQGFGLSVGKFTSSPALGLIVPGNPDQLLLSNGDGTFTLENTSCGVEPATVSDFNKDGKLDLAGPTTVGGVAVIGVCLGNSDGTFTVGGNFDQGITHHLTLAGDFNNDGKLDLVASDQGGFSVLLGNGDGTFQNGIPTAANATFPILGAGDFNNDGKLDVIMATPTGIAVFLGKGDGTFAAPLVTFGPTSGIITAADLNKDGKKDLVIAVQDGPLYVMLGKGDGTFEAPVRYKPLGGCTTRAVIADLNLDGKLDVAVGTNNGDVVVLFGDGTGTLPTQAAFRVEGRSTALATADFNGDKKPDLAVAVQGAIVTLLHQ